MSIIYIYICLSQFQYRQRGFRSARNIMGISQTRRLVVVKRVYYKLESSVAINRSYI